MAASDTLGTGWGFPPQFYNNGKDVWLVSDEDDVKEALEILLSTALQERLYYSDFGCDLQQYMFNEVNRALVTEIQQTILNAAYDYEPRVEIAEIEITEFEEDAMELLINIKYLITSTGSEQNLVYSFSLE